MQTSLLNLFGDPPPAPDWVEECPGRWVRYSHPFRLVAQQDRPGLPWRWGCHHWPTMAPHRNGSAPSAKEGAQLAEAALADLQ